MDSLMTGVDWEDDGSHAGIQGSSASRSSDRRKHHAGIVVLCLLSGALHASPFAVARRLLCLLSVLGAYPLLVAFSHLVVASAVPGLCSSLLLARNTSRRSHELIKTSRTIGVGPSDKFEQGR